MRARTPSLVLALLLAIAVAGCADDEPAALVTPDAGGGAADYEYVIERGTGDRIRAAEDVQILPAELEVRVGETIRIVNQDDEGHFVGIFYVDAGETVTQRFASAGEYTGQCTVHPSGQLSLRILP